MNFVKRSWYVSLEFSSVVTDTRRVESGGLKSVPIVAVSVVHVDVDDVRFVEAGKKPVDLTVMGLSDWRSSTHDKICNRCRPNL